jgi:tRNA(Leu) C34 or U34 (ribose-2'-O)-methylase TrmL
MRKLKNSELDRLSVEDFKETEKTPLIIVLDNIRSLNNIGSVFRTSDAFLIEKIYLCGITATPPHRDIHKTALGSTETVAWEYFENTIELIKKLKDENVIVASIEQAESATMLNNFQPQPNQKYALVFGNEVKGVAQNVVSASDLILEIPQFGTKHSLNISVSCGVVVWDLFAKMKTFLVLLCFLALMVSCKAGSNIYDLSIQDKMYLNSVVDSIYELDQSSRYGFDKIDSLYRMEKGFMMKRAFGGKEKLGDEFENYNRKIDSIWDYLKIIDDSNTRELIAITKKYGFPNNKRLDVNKSKAYFIFVHSPRNYFDEIRTLINREYENGRISEYEKGYIFWHLDGRKGMPPMSGKNGEAIWN